ncbi:MAG: YolD-like family protein [Erysipelotrichaceae bacterium]|nr:YolD-like family protein [Erysipelotrichaceae bacterium]
MKKWAPYKSLNEQDNYLKKLHEKNQKINKPKISSDEAEIINNILVNYHGQELTITYWRDEKVNTVVAIISKIDPINKKIVLVNRKTILMNEIIGLTEN